MKAYVLDASFIVEAFTVKGRARSQMRILLQEVAKKEAQLHAPSLLAYEFGNAMLSGKFSAEELDMLYVRFDSLQIELATPSSVLLRMASDAAAAQKTALYDMAYHQLALLLAGIFITCDAKYYAKARELGSIELVPIA